jgi:hypothetical protein
MTWWTAPVSLSPLTEREKYWAKSAALRGNRVDHFRWYLIVRLAVDNSISLQFPQGLGQHFLRGFGNAAAQFAETQWAILEII